MSTYMAEALMDSLIAFARAGAEGPKEIMLPSHDYLWLADDLGLGVAPVAGMAPRAVTKDSGRYDRISIERTFSVREVWIGDSFIFNGPTGPVTIREARQ